MANITTGSGLIVFVVITYLIAGALIAESGAFPEFQNQGQNLDQQAAEQLQAEDNDGIFSGITSFFSNLGSIVNFTMRLAGVVFTMATFQLPAPIWFNVLFIGPLNFMLLLGIVGLIRGV